MPQSKSYRIRWWPAMLITVLAAGGIIGVREIGNIAFQARNIATFSVGLATIFFLGVWWLGFSRASGRTRIGVFVLFLIACGAIASAYRIRGMSGDFAPIIELRWTKIAMRPARKIEAKNIAESKIQRGDFTQFLGPNRNCVVTGPQLARDWKKNAPQILWRQPIGAAWSGFAILGNHAVTQEQRAENEMVSCFDLFTGKKIWEHADAAHYQTTIAGEGPRATPTLHGGLVFALGATGILNCLDLETGRAIWSRKITDDAHVGVPEWGFASSPLIVDGNVVVSAGGAGGRSLLAYREIDGKPAWTAGSQPINYSSPAFATLAGVPQILMFNTKFITAHDPKTGAILWEYPWGIGQPHVAQPVPVGENRVVFSSGYGVGAELLELKKNSGGKIEPQQIWKTLNLRAKFASFVFRDGFIYGLDDGILTCIDVRDGGRKWKAGRYGHGQILLVNELLLITAENGELILLAPTPDGPNELARFHVFDSKTWNPPAISGDLLLMRTDMEAACIRLPLALPR